METEWKKGEVHNCVIKLRENPRRRKAKVRVGCGAGFAGDRPAAALKLLQKVEELDYLVLECLAERTLADRYHLKAAGQKGYDPRRMPYVANLNELAKEGMNGFLNDILNEIANLPLKKKMQVVLSDEEAEKVGLMLWQDIKEEVFVSANAVAPQQLKIRLARRNDPQSQLG